jgi:pimeloyl-ACP methyl ester carboxylesterase
MAEFTTLLREDGERIAYMARTGASPGILWLGGFKSEMTATKASALDAWAERTGHAFVRFDYFGHGQSSGEFPRGTITRWRDDALLVLDRLTSGPQVLVGSSMGGYLALLVARMRPERTAALLLIAPAADFTEALLWAGMPEDAKRQVLEKGEWLRPSQYDPKPYPISRTLIEDGRRHLILGGGPIALGCPVRILQGMQDPDVPWQHAFRLFRAISGEASLTLVRDGDHRLSAPFDIVRMEHALDALVAQGAAR